MMSSVLGSRYVYFGDNDNAPPQAHCVTKRASATVDD
jgi:hypothetical protein